MQRTGPRVVPPAHILGVSKVRKSVRTRTMARLHPAAHRGGMQGRDHPCGDRRATASASMATKLALRPLRPATRRHSQSALATHVSKIFKKSCLKFDYTAMWLITNLTGTYLQFTPPLSTTSSAAPGWPRRAHRAAEPSAVPCPCPREWLATRPRARAARHPCRRRCAA